MNRMLLTACLIVMAGVALTACRTVSERPASTPNEFWGIALNGGRTQAITVNPSNSDEVVIATQFGGLWRTTDGGAHWRHLNGLNEVFVHDVQFGTDGTTLIATVGRTNHVDHHGGIWVSWNDGATWTRPASSRPPASARIPNRPVAQGIALDPDNPRRWYVGTDFGVAVSDDNGATWSHAEVDSSVGVDADRLQQAVQSVLAFPGGSVLAMTRWGIYRSDSDGAAGTWRRVRNEGFSFYESGGWNKMDRSPYWPYAFVLKDYSTLYLYELGADRWTALALPADAVSRGPFVRIGKPVSMPGYITIWVGQGTRALKVTRKRIGSLRAIGASSWSIFGRGEGVHDDMGDLGVDVGGRPVMIGSDGGVFKPDPANPGRWIGAAPAGSGMNSYLMTDLLGVNSEHEGRAITALHFATQDNAVWGSPDYGGTWNSVDCCEGFHTEGPVTSATPATVAYGRTGAGYSDSRVGESGLTSQRNLSDADEDGTSYVTKDSEGNITGSTAGQAFYLKPGRWIRGRFPAGANQQILVSGDDGATWRRRFDLTVNMAGVFQRTKTHYPITYVKAYLPVFTGATNPDGSMQIGLVRLYNLMRTRTDTIGATSVMTLPSNGSLGQRATEFDWQAVFGAHPKDWRFVIAPDIVNGDIKVTHDGGLTWTTDTALTSLVTDGGALRLWDGGAYLMQVTHIAFDPYRDGRILVGTREAGVLCSDDGGVHWGRIPKSRPILYATGFQFRQDGNTLISTYGRGLWSLLASASTCVDGRPPRERGFITVDRIPDWVLVSDIAEYVGTPQQIEPDEEERREPPADDANRPRLIVDTGIPSMTGPVLGAAGSLEITAVGFDLTNELVIELDGQRVQGKIRRTPRAAHIALDLPRDLTDGPHRVSIRQQSSAGQHRASFEFRKAHLDEHLGEPERDGDHKGAEEPTFEELEALERGHDDSEVPLKPEVHVKSAPSVGS